MTIANREKQMADAEELLGDRLANVGFVKGLFFGTFANQKLLPYPDLATDRATAPLCDELRHFCQAEIDPVAIDRDALIPERVVEGLGRLGILARACPKSAADAD